MPLSRDEITAILEAALSAHGAFIEADKDNSDVLCRHTRAMTGIATLLFKYAHPETRFPTSLQLIWDAFCNCNELRAHMMRRQVREEILAALDVAYEQEQQLMHLAAESTAAASTSLLVSADGAGEAAD